MATSTNLLLFADQDELEFPMLDNTPHLSMVGTDTFPEGIEDVEAIFYWSGTKDLLQKVFARCERLRWIHSRSAGLDGRLFPELIKSDVVLTNGKGVFSASLGEFALAAMLHFAKDFPRMRRNQNAKKWVPFDVEMIAGKTVGIVGYGDIGRAAAVRAKAMGMKVLATKRHPPAETDPLIERYYRPDALHELLAVSDYVVITAPLTPETRHMIGEAEFAVMKPTAVVINVGRGAIIDEAAMVRALQEGRIKGAGLDVTEVEPLPESSPLYGMDNVLLSPHCADNIVTWKKDAMDFFLEQYARFQKNEPLENVVNKTLGY